jgi:small subunit ribosomal protein S16
VAVKIRLKRVGKIRTPHYRIVIADSRTKRDGRVIEEIGTYNPKTEPSTIKLQSERAQYWLSVGAQPTEAVAAILKLTGDIGGQATLRDPEPRPDKAALFDAALKEIHAEPKTAKKAAKKAAPKADEDQGDESAEPKARKAAKKADKAEEAPAEESKAEDTPAEDAPAEEAKADEAPAEEAKADEAPAEEAKADEAPADEAKADESAEA